MEVDYFGVLTSIVNKKNIKDEDVTRLFNGFAAISWLGNHPQAVYEANAINSSRGIKYIDKLSEYKALKGLINIPRKTYIKGDKKDKNYSIIIRTLSEHFKIGRLTAQQYYKMLKGEQIIEILTMYARLNESNFGPKEVKKVNEVRSALIYAKKTLKDKK